MGIKIKPDAWVSVDTLSIIAPLDNFSPDQIPNLPYAEVITNATKVGKFGMRYKVAGKYKLHNAVVRHDPVRNRLIVEGSSAGVLLGQNVFGERNPMVAGYALLRYVCEQLELPISDELYGRWKSGDFELKRVDLAVNFQLESRQKVLAILKQMGHQLIVQKTSMRSVQTSVYHIPGGGKSHSMVCYEKGSEMQHRLHSVVSRNKVQDRSYRRFAVKCQKMLRVELRLLHSELKRLGLNKASNWNENSGREIFSIYAEKMPVHRVLRAAEMQKILAQATPVEKLFMVAHQYYPGPMTDLYTEKTYKTYRSRYGRKWGVDLKVRPSGFSEFTPSLQISDIEGEEAFPFSYAMISTIGWDRLPIPPDVIINGDGYGL